MRAKVYVVVGTVLFLVAVLNAQGASLGSFISWASGSGTCPSPVAGVSTLCAADPTQITASFGGSPYVSLKGVDGKVGPQGIQGIQGVQGAAGKDGAPGKDGVGIKASFKCSGMSVDATGVTLSGCQ